jgi:hypothetical protein
MIQLRKAKDSNIEMFKLSQASQAREDWLESWLSLSGLTISSMFRIRFLEGTAAHIIVFGNYVLTKSTI